MDEWARAAFSGTLTIAGLSAPRGGAICTIARGVADRETGRPNTAETVFSIGSITKAVTAASIMGLVDDGRLVLDDQVGDLLPELTGPLATVTVDQLVLHTSGLTGSLGEDHEPLSREEALAKLRRAELAFTPGTSYQYSNAAYTLLALVIDAVAAEGYRGFTARILALPDGERAGGFWDGDPAAPGPRAVGYDDEGRAGERGDFTGPHWALDGNGALAMTTTDLARWTAALFAGGIVSESSAEAIGEPVVDHGDGTFEARGWVRFGPDRFGEPVLATAGGGGSVGHEAVVAWLPETERVIAVATNTPDVTAEELLERIAPAFVEGAAWPRPAGGVAAVDPAELAAREGTYELPSGGTFVVRARDDSLVLTARGVDAVEALAAVPADVTPDEVAEHERAVLALLAGGTETGDEERAALTRDIGPIEDVAPAGTIFAGGELRTYVVVRSGADEAYVWYALEGSESIAAVEIGSPPTVELIPTGPATFRRDDPTAALPELAVTFTDAGMTLTPDEGAAVSATRSRDDAMRD